MRKQKSSVSIQWEGGIIIKSGLLKDNNLKKESVIIPIVMILLTVAVQLFVAPKLMELAETRYAPYYMGYYISIPQIGCFFCGVLLSNLLILSFHKENKYLLYFLFGFGALLCIPSLLMFISGIFEIIGQSQKQVLTVFLKDIMWNHGLFVLHNRIFPLLSGIFLRYSDHTLKRREDR